MTAEEDGCPAEGQQGEVVRQAAAAKSTTVSTTCAIVSAGDFGAVVASSSESLRSPNRSAPRRASVSPSVYRKRSLAVVDDGLGVAEAGVSEHSDDR